MSTIPSKAPGLTAAQHAASLDAYQRDGAARAKAIGNRGLIRLDANDRLHPEILAAYNRHGFYVFEGAVDAPEVEQLRADVLNMIDRAPVAPDSSVDAKGRPALGLDYARSPYRLAKPLSDPFGGTAQLGGRHPHQMEQPKAADDAPEYVPFIMYSMCEAMPSGLRLYGHPDLLTIAEAINGPDFVPYNDAIFVKQPGLGASVSWHQDGVTHWDSPSWDSGIHGFNFQVQLFGASLANCLWVVPGTHKLGRIDINAKIQANGGSDTLPDALPLVCEAGDVTIVNRQLLHGSFANTSPDMRVSLTFGFHRRSSVLGAKAALRAESDEVLDEERIFKRSSVVQLAIDARQQAYGHERRFEYKPFAHMQDDLRFNEESFGRLIKNYFLSDLSI